MELILSVQSPADTVQTLPGTMNSLKFESPSRRFSNQKATNPDLLVNGPHPL
ncbi:MAG: hypothetical protein H7Z13_19160 [Ferruginibacter sp.]|nr:hypothetical protein [Ferruginibacter sp.]